ncbi:hypothetical protein PROFUN_01822 [Planoprotostelium fungivorum]|uniref:Uncharacterized protein n=1 Tax=Planoprotostelium fungivorum TaxID=1890364 RepID=A0A2P6NYT6_9EUKA|nr:hypothetical protein PROFUN_01822 [Planoprotostelium fungivorum]
MDACLRNYSTGSERSVGSSSTRQLDDIVFPWKRYLFLFLKLSVAGKLSQKVTAY